MAALLLLEARPQRLQKFVEAAHGLDQLLFFLSEVFFGELLQPLGWDFDEQRIGEEFEALEHVAEHAVELVEIALVLDQRRAREVVKILDAPRREVVLHRLHEGEIFAQRHRYAGGFQLGEKGHQHGGSVCIIVAHALATTHWRESILSSPRRQGPIFQRPAYVARWVPTCAGTTPK